MTRKKVWLAIAIFAASSGLAAACDGGGGSAGEGDLTADVAADDGGIELADLAETGDLPDADLRDAEAGAEALSEVADANEVAEIEVSDTDAARDAEVEAEVPDTPPPLPVAPGYFYQVHLPDVALDSQGESEQLLVDLPAETTAVFVMVSSEDDFAFFTLRTVVTPPPNNQIVVKGAGDATCVPCANRVVAAQKVASFLIPNDPEIPVGGGEWVFRIRSTAILKTAIMTQYLPRAGTCDVIVLARTAPIPETGTLRVHFHYTGSAGLTAETAPTDERMQTGIDEMAALFATAGIALEVGGYHDVPGVDEDPALLDPASTLGAPNDLSKLLLTGQADDPLAVNIFFVNSIYKDDDFTPTGGLVLGIAGGVPGPAFIGPSYRSGVAIATVDLGAQQDFFGNVLAHEVAHYLGLFHSTEQDGMVHDTLSDTAEGDPTNLMYWAYSPDQREISEQQGIVLRSHPMILTDEQ